MNIRILLGRHLFQRQKKFAVTRAMEEDELDVKSVGEVVREITSRNNGGYKKINWYLLGMYINVEIHDLDALERRYPEDKDRCLIEMIDIWIKKGLGSWLTLAHGLKNIGLLTLAQNIALMHKLDLKQSEDTDIDLSRQDEDIEVDVSLRQSIAEIANKDQQISQSRTQLSNTMGSLKENESAVQILRNEAKKAVSEIEELNSRNKHLNTLLQEKQKQSDALKEYLKESPDDVMESLLNNLNEEILNLIAEITENVKRIEVKETEVEIKTQEIELQNKDIIGLKKTMETLEQTLTELEKSLSAKTENLEIMHKARKDDIEKMNADLEKQSQELCKMQREIYESGKKIIDLLRERTKLKKQISICRAELVKLKAQKIQDSKKILQVTQEMITLVNQCNEITKQIFQWREVKEKYPYWCKHWLLHKDYLCDPCMKTLEEERQKHEEMTSLKLSDGINSNYGPK